MFFNEKSYFKAAAFFLFFSLTNVWQDAILFTDQGRRMRLFITNNI